MMNSPSRIFDRLGKLSFLPAAAMLLLSGCGVNPATGDRQFAALMSPAQEVRVGAEEHQKVLQTFGAMPAGDPVQQYVQQIGQRITADTERPDVQFRFFLVDSPMVNAFAIPGGYVYVTRGLVAQANSEVELAAVMAHEVGHITGRHSAERYSQSVLASLGGALLSTALDSRTATQAFGVGSNLYLSSYSRGQEHQADELGIRYLHRAGYNPEGMAWFLRNLEAQTALEQRLAGRNGTENFASSFFSTHPQTGERVARAQSLAAQYPPNENIVRRDEYLSMIDGIVYGDSARHGLIRDNAFYHPEIGFTFSAPSGFRLINQPEQVIATHENGAVMIFDAAGNPNNIDPATYLARHWMEGQDVQNAEQFEINGMPAATATFTGRVNNRDVVIRLIAVRWAPDTFFRFQMAVPQGAPAALAEELRRSAATLRPMSASERQQVRPYRIRIITAQAGDSAASLGARMPFRNLPEERFRTLNGMLPGAQVTAGQRYKIVVED